jgi:hypothetical protein
VKLENKLLSTKTVPCPKEKMMILANSRCGIRVAILMVDLAMCETDAQRIEVHERIVASLKELEAGVSKGEDRAAIRNARLAVLDAEVELEKAKAPGDSQKPER